MILDVQLCGNSLKTENVTGSKCVFIGLDACVGPMLIFGFSGFIRVYYAKKKGVPYSSLNDESLNPNGNDDDYRDNEQFGDA